jgi:hypothetical protein
MRMGIISSIREQLLKLLNHPVRMLEPARCVAAHIPHTSSAAREESSEGKTTLSHRQMETNMDIINPLEPEKPNSVVSRTAQKVSC